MAAIQRVPIPRRKILITLLVVIPLGFGSKFYRGPGAGWVNNYAGGILYEVFWCLVVAFIQPKASGFRIALWILGITSLLECLQLWHPPFLETIRSTFIGQTLVGTSFTWWDFPYYIIGCGIGWAWIDLIRKSASR